MKFVIIALSLFIAVMAQDDLAALDKVDIAEIIGNKRLMEANAKCLLEKGPCTADAKRFRDNIPEGKATKCAKCTPTHKEKGKQLADALKSQFPELYSEVLAKYEITEEELRDIYSQ